MKKPVVFDKKLFSSLQKDIEFSKECIIVKEKILEKNVNKLYVKLSHILLKQLRKQQCQYQITRISNKLYKKLKKSLKQGSNSASINVKDTPINLEAANSIASEIEKDPQNPFSISVSCRSKINRNPFTLKTYTQFIIIIITLKSHVFSFLAEKESL